MVITFSIPDTQYTLVVRMDNEKYDKEDTPLSVWSLNKLESKGYMTSSTSLMFSKQNDFEILSFKLDNLTEKEKKINSIILDDDTIVNINQLIIQEAVLSEAYDWIELEGLGLGLIFNDNSIARIILDIKKYKGMMNGI